MGLLPSVGGVSALYCESEGHGQMGRDDLTYRGAMGEWRHGFVGELKSDLFLFFNLKIQLSKTGIINWDEWRNGSVIENNF